MSSEQPVRISSMTEVRLLIDGGRRRGVLTIARENRSSEEIFQVLR